MQQRLSSYPCARWDGERRRKSADHSQKLFHSLAAEACTDTANAEERQAAAGRTTEPFEDKHRSAQLPLTVEVSAGPYQHCAASLSCTTACSAPHWLLLCLGCHWQCYHCHHCCRGELGSACRGAPFNRQESGGSSGFLESRILNLMQVSANRADISTRRTDAFFL